jgi:hypothetical protein
VSLFTCASCGQPCADVVVLEHKRKDERAPVEWMLGRCCFGTPATATLTHVKATQTKGRK